MKNKTFLLLCVMGIGWALPAISQKIGYANVDLILAYMPESKTMNQALQTYQQKLAQQLQVKQEYAQMKMSEYQEKIKSRATEASLKPLQDDLMKLDSEIQKEAQNSEQKLMTRRQDLMVPVVEKLQKAIKDVAAENGFEYVLNTVDGSGVSIVLHAPEGNDLTERIMKKLGIQVPAGTGN